MFTAEELQTLTDADIAARGEAHALECFERMSDVFPTRFELKAPDPESYQFSHHLRTIADAISGIADAQRRIAEAEGQAAPLKAKKQRYFEVQAELERRKDEIRAERRAALEAGEPAPNSGELATIALDLEELAGLIFMNDQLLLSIDESGAHRHLTENTARYDAALKALAYDVGEHQKKYIELFYLQFLARLRNASPGVSRQVFPCEALRSLMQNGSIDLPLQFHTAKVEKAEEEERRYQIERQQAAEAATATPEPEAAPEPEQAAESAPAPVDAPASASPQIKAPAAPRKRKYVRKTGVRVSAPKKTQRRPAAAPQQDEAGAD